MKKFGLIIAFAMLFTLASCDNYNDGNTNTRNSSVINLENKYPGYYASFDEGIVSITNYDPINLGNLPSYQEMIEYGDGAGLKNKGAVYCIYIVDTTALSTETNEKCYYAELEDATMNLLIEEDSYFANAEERKEIVDKLIEIMKYVRNESNE